MVEGRAGVMADLLIGLDWGTSACRAYLMRRDGTVLETLAGDEGILAVPPGGFAAVLATKTAGWRAAHGDLPMIASGMIGSRQGWREAPYVACPAGLPELAAGLLPVDSDRGRVWLVPGVTCRSADGTPDVVRGEETQIFGCAAAAGQRFFVLPGTHSKWMLVEDGRIVRFFTFMTGEVFAVLTQHSILGRLMAGDAPDPEAFKAGLARARRGGPLLHDLFSARTLGLFDLLPAAGLNSYLSGLLIGSELAGVAGLAAADSSERTVSEATIVAGAALARRYEEALAVVGIAAEVAPADVAARGLARIAAAAGIGAGA
jgi:2-dehydro-3-deoxygalactonokinase